jgi:hypothetical protein
MNVELLTILSAHLSSVSLRCSRLDTGEIQIHVNGFLLSPGRGRESDQQ